MRIQHNIMAMGAYRNYTNNLSAMQKNLEKLSSGYKINRAGDDAAGLAISEKMRAQITGLNTAQKNAKDGISLVQTAEGALTEVHDMLNRMVTLSTQSANGTYDNETDRVQLQKELDQLLNEINRIADSSNFNGIQLLDGSMSAEGVQPVSSKFELPAVGNILGTDTVLHQDEDEASASTYFGLDLHNMKFSGDENDSFTIKIGNTKLVGTLKDAGTVTGEDMVAALTGTDTSKLEFTVGGNALDPTKVTIEGEEYRIESGTHQTTGGGGEKTGAIFKLNSTKSGVDVSFDVSITDNRPTDAAAPTTPSVEATGSTTPEAVSSAGGLVGNGRTNAEATVEEYKSTGRINTSQVTLAKRDTIDTTGVSTNPIAVIAGGRATPITVDATKATYTFSFTDAEISKIQDIIDDLNTAASTVGNGDLTIGISSGNIQLKVGTAVIAEVAASSLSSTGSVQFVGKDSSSTQFGSITVTDKTGNSSWSATTDAAGELTSLSGSTGVKVATITVGASNLETDALTTAALNAEASAGDVKLTYANNRVELQINGKTIGFADPEQVNQTTQLHFTDVGGNDLGYISLADNGELKASDISNLDTGVTYADANLTYTLGTVDHDKIAEEIKRQVLAGTDFGSDTGLDLSYDGTNNKFSLTLNGHEIGSASSISTGVVDIKDTGNNVLLSFTLSDTGVTISQLATDTKHASFTDIGINVTLNKVDKATVDTTSLGTSTNATAIAKAATAAATAANSTISLEDLDGKSLTVSYNANAATPQYELKIGDLVVGAASGPATVTSNATTLNFTSVADSTALGSVTISNLKSDFKDADLVGEIDTTIKFNKAGTPAITADYGDLDKDALAEFAKENGVADGAKLEAIFDQGSKNWTLQFNDGTNPAVTVATATLTDGDKSIEFTDFGTVKFSDAINTSTLANVGLTTTTVTMDTGLQYKETELKTGLEGDFLVTASNQMNTNSAGGDRLASTVLTLTSDMVTDGASLFVAGKTYTFSTGKDTVVADGAVKVDISDLDSSSDSYMSDVVKRLTAAYNDDNTGVYTLGWNGKNVTVTETKSHGMLKDNGSSVADGTYAADEWDLTTFDGIKKSLGYSTAASKGSSLTLQIGDTAEKFNQLEVNIKDCHAAAMGLDGLDISTQAAAAESVDKIKAAINYVSDVRGTLGATQNRLDHTINNLSVMTENIQDAESTIRDTDVAEEMMAYTKNNILIQSAQAMLAQANQVPQGVLQLLQ